VSKFDQLSPQVIREFALASLLDHIDQGHYDYWSDDRTAMRKSAIAAFGELEEVAHLVRAIARDGAVMEYR
jgi:hypothetical protein